ncbi:Transcriptional regulator [uncultured Sporomusa sp.]|uniref:Transcriptional regulator n=1 Tax=uncultured Sporomusa sp. TaxID=307249 RepID=A0A212LZ89_9FIRM|nr:LysR family transcriptional regulator [uncultured Sporomusa sp.]SCM82862.1 Transcriptional regulator [uncultured Sporomusa sp.]
MDLLQLKYFQVVARLENITRAAEELHIAQPSLSKTIARLEESLGVPLFERTGKRIRLNLFGETFLTRVDRVFNELENGQRDLTNLAGLTDKSVTVGVSSSRLLQNFLKEYLTAHPDIKFRLRHITNQQELQTQLITGKIDLSIFFSPIIHPEIHCEPLLVEEIFLAVPPNHRLAERPGIHLKEAADESFINVTTDFGFRTITTNFCLQAGFTPTVAFEIESIDMIASLVNAGLGVAFLPACWYQEESQKNSPVSLHIETPSCRRTFWLAWRKERYLPEAMRNFSKSAIEYFSSAKAKTFPG